MAPLPGALGQKIVRHYNSAASGAEDDSHNLAPACALGKARNSEARLPAPKIDPLPEDSPGAQEQSGRMAACQNEDAPCTGQGE